MKKLILLTFLIISHSSQASLGWFLFGAMLGSNSKKTKTQVVENEKKVVVPQGGSTCFISFIDSWGSKQMVNTSYIVSAFETDTDTCVKEKRTYPCLLDFNDGQGCVARSEEGEVVCVEKEKVYFSHLVMINEDTHKIQTSLEEFYETVKKHCR